LITSAEDRLKSVLLEWIWLMISDGGTLAPTISRMLSFLKTPSAVTGCGTGAGGVAAGGVAAGGVETIVDCCSLNHQNPRMAQPASRTIPRAATAFGQAAFFLLTARGDGGACRTTGSCWVPDGSGVTGGGVTGGGVTGSGVTGAGVARSGVTGRGVTGGGGTGSGGGATNDR
jgi:hypothetical protein